MALPTDPIGFLFGGTNGAPSYDELKRRREAADLMAAKILGRQPKSVMEGIGQALQSASIGIDQRRTDAALDEGRNKAVNSFQQDILDKITGQPGLVTAPTTSPATAAANLPTSGVADEVAATSPNPKAASFSGNQQDFISALLPAAIEEGKRTGVDPRIIVGQAALETGYGKHAPGNNYFGIKSHGQDGGNSLMTTEIVNGQPVRQRDSFRAYAGPEDSVRGYGDFILQNPRYKDFRSAQGLDAQVAALQASGYATDPNYGSKVASIARGIQLPTEVASLDQSAGMSPAAAAIETQAPGSGTVAPMQMQPNAYSSVGQPSASGSYLRPFKPGERRTNPDGSYSTELSTTWQLPDGSWANVPSLWMGQNGPQEFDPGDEQGILGAMRTYERQTGQQFPRFRNQQEAEQAAQARSAAGGAGAPTVSSQQPPSALPTLPSINVAPAPAVASQPAQQPQQRPQQVAQNTSGISQAQLIRAMSDPYLPEEMRNAARMLYQQQAQKDQLAQQEQTWRARQDYEWDKKRSDPAYQLEQDIKRAQLKALTAKTGNRNVVNAGNGQLYDQNTGEWISAPKTSPGTGNAFRFGGTSVEAQALNGLIESGRLTVDQAQDLAAGKEVTGPNGETIFMTPQGIFGTGGNQPKAPPQGVDIFEGQPESQPPVNAAPPVSGVPQNQPQAAPNGALTLTGPKAPNEGQANAGGFADRMRNAETVLSQFENMGTDGWQQLGSKLPGGNYMLSPEFQRYERARRDFVNAVLRRESGAAIGDGEFVNADRQYFPQPGDSAEVIADKKRARELVLSGMVRSAGPAYRPLDLLPQTPSANTKTDRGIAQPKSEAEFNALPSGAEFIAPDGSRRRKP